MYPYDHSSGAVDRPTPVAGGAARWFKRGDATQGIPGSVVTADHLNDLEGNIRTLLAAGSITGVKGIAGDSDLLNAIIRITALQSAETGDVKLTIRPAASSGWVMMNDGSIGSAASGATARANTDCEALFSLLWALNASDVPIQTSAGGGATRGASFTADWNANRRLVLMKTLGRSLATAGSGSGLSARRLGETLGEESHTLTGAEMQHNHALATANRAQGPAGGVFVPDPVTAGVQSITATPHNNMQPTTFFNVVIKL